MRKYLFVASSAANPQMKIPAIINDACTQMMEFQDIIPIIAGSNDFIYQ